MTCEIFGILNVTPDSFSDGGQFLEEKKALAQAEKLFSEGADYIDVGGQSTRPGADEITSEEEWFRIKNVIKKMVEAYVYRISLDTKNHETARAFLKLGGKIINDVSGFQDENMQNLAAKYQCLCIINHFPGKNIADVHEQEICSINQVRDELLTRKQQLLDAGVKSENIILDPGLGFGKTKDLNWELLKFPAFVPDEKVMIGHSRKRFLGEKRFEKETNQKAAQIAIEAGARYLRVHESFFL